MCWGDTEKMQYTLLIELIFLKNSDTATLGSCDPTVQCIHKGKEVCACVRACVYVCVPIFSQLWQCYL